MSITGDLDQNVLGLKSRHRSCNHQAVGSSIDLHRNLLYFSLFLHMFCSLTIRRGKFCQSLTGMFLLLWWLIINVLLILPPGSTRLMAWRWLVLSRLTLRLSVLVLLSLRLVRITLVTLELSISPLPLPVVGRAWLATTHDIL